MDHVERQAPLIVTRRWADTGLVFPCLWASPGNEREKQKDAKKNHKRILKYDLQQSCDIDTKFPDGNVIPGWGKSDRSRK